MSMEVVEHSLSEFMYRPDDVVAELADRDVLLRRRGAPALRLSNADRDRERSEAFTASAKLLRSLAVHNPAALGEALGEAFAWVEFLPASDRELFAEELTRALLAAASGDVGVSVAQLVHEWKATAEIHTDPELVRQLSEPLEAVGGAVAKPAG